MPSYIALLRAVNVGGTGKLPMTELAAMCEACGFAKAKTFIASGNVVFTSKLSEAKVKAALDPYLDEPISSADHEYAACVYNESRNQGVEPGTVDILICAVAVRRGWEVLSGDGGLNRCLAMGADTK